MLESTSSFGKFEFRPLEPGFGMTVGNALRRILLSSCLLYTSPRKAGTAPLRPRSWIPSPRISSVRTEQFLLFSDTRDSPVSYTHLIDKITKIFGMEITFVTTAATDEEAYALLREFGLPFKNAKKNNQ